MAKKNWVSGPMLFYVILLLLFIYIRGTCGPSGVCVSGLEFGDREKEWPLPLEDVSIFRRVL